MKSKPSRKPSRSSAADTSAPIGAPGPKAELLLRVRGPALSRSAARMAGNPAVSVNEPLGRRLAAMAAPGRPLVSIITVVLNRERTLPDAMRSVLSQDYEPIEYIMIDGGSTDGTVDLIRAQADRLYAWVSEADEGISDAFNRGIGLARGEIIGILNSDDWYEAQTVTRVVAALGARPAAALACGRLLYWKGDRPDAIFPSQPERLGVDMTINHPATFVRRTAYERAGLFRLDYRYAMDYELVLRFQALGYEFASVDAVLANMRYDGAADRNWLRSLREMRRAQRAIYPGDVRLGLLYVLKFARSCVARALAALGLGAVNRFYRSRLSRFRRSYERAG